MIPETRKFKNPQVRQHEREIVCIFEKRKGGEVVFSISLFKTHACICVHSWGIWKFTNLLRKWTSTSFDDHRVLLELQAKVAGDATKAAAAERLGMGGISRGRVAHSVALGARTIAQADASGREARRQPEEKKDDEWEVVDTVKWGRYGKKS